MDNEPPILANLENSLVAPWACVPLLLSALFALSVCLPVFSKALPRPLTASVVFLDVRLTNSVPALISSSLSNISSEERPMALPIIATSPSTSSRVSLSLDSCPSILSKLPNDAASAILVRNFSENSVAWISWYCTSSSCFSKSSAATVESNRLSESLAAWLDEVPKPLKLIVPEASLLIACN